MLLGRLDGRRQADLQTAAVAAQGEGRLPERRSLRAGALGLPDGVPLDLFGNDFPKSP